MTAPRAIHLPKLCVVRIIDGDWTADLLDASIPHWIEFYTILRDRKGGKYAAKYQPTIDALEELLRGMDERIHANTAGHSPTPRTQDCRHG